MKRHIEIYMPGNLDFISYDDLYFNDETQTYNPAKINCLDIWGRENSRNIWECLRINSTILMRDIAYFNTLLSSIWFAYQNKRNKT